MAFIVLSLKVQGEVGTSYFGFMHRALIGILGFLCVYDLAKMTIMDVNKDATPGGSWAPIAKAMARL